MSATLIRVPRARYTQLEDIMRHNFSACRKKDRAAHKSKDILSVITIIELTQTAEEFYGHLLVEWKCLNLPRLW